MTNISNPIKPVAFGSTNRNEQLRRLEKEIKHSPIEKGYLISGKGKILKEIKGTKKSLPLSGYLSEYRMRDKTTVTHNHPGPEISLSVADIFTAVEMGLYEIRAITPKGSVYSLRIPQNFRNKGLTGRTDFCNSTLEPLVQSIHEKIRPLFKAGKFTLESAQHALWQQVFKELGWSYHRIPGRAKS